MITAFIHANSRDCKIEVECEHLDRDTNPYLTIDLDSADGQSHLFLLREQAQQLATDLRRATQSVAEEELEGDLDQLAADVSDFASGLPDAQADALLAIVDLWRPVQKRRRKRPVPQPPTQPVAS